MYNFEWDKRTRGYRLLTKTANFVANEIRPVFKEELELLQVEKNIELQQDEGAPFLWAKQNVYLYQGEEIARLCKPKYNEPLKLEWKSDFVTLSQGKLISLKPVNIDGMVAQNHDIMSALVADTLKRIKEMYDDYVKKCDVVYIGFSCGKDSMVLLDLCHRVLPLDVPVVFSDTDMELPDTYVVWEKVQKQYKGRQFLRVTAEKSALENWDIFGPPSQSVRWCCAVHKSTPALLELKRRIGKNSIKALAFVGVRGDESLRRATYDDIGDGLKSQSQVNAMPILAWSAHELWLYIFANNLILNDAYKKGIPRVGCLMCPMSSERQNSLIQTNYSSEVSAFADAVRNALAREFTSQEDSDAFVYEGGWHARKSGVSLKQVIAEPGVHRQKDKVEFDYPLYVQSELYQWLKTIPPKHRKELAFREEANKGVLQYQWEGSKVNRALSKWIGYAVRKAIACTGCHVCEAECPSGALRFNSHGKGKCIVSIDESLCIHCMKCFSPEEGCWRYFSKRYTGATTMTISGINKYVTFGLKPEWIETLINEEAGFRQTTMLGNRMIPSAVTWFRETGLIKDVTAIVPTLLLDIAKKRGPNDLLLWQLFWIRLANISPLVKWYLCNSTLNVKIALKDLDSLLEQSVSSKSVRKGAFSSLCQLIKNSPLGADNGLIQVGFKGKNVESLKRCQTIVEPLVTLYGLYVIAEKTGRNSFTVRQMMTAEFEGEFISPIIAFGFSAEEFKKQCMGLASLYPEFISCSFTLGLDEIQVFSDVKNRENVIELI